jgi:hypothetical protein
VIVRGYDIGGIDLGQHPLFATATEPVQIAAAVAAIVCGVIFLLYGFRVYRVLVVLVSAFIGVLAGMSLGPMVNVNPVLLAVIGAVVLALMGWLLFRSFVGLLGGIAMAAAVPVALAALQLNVAVSPLLISGVSFFAGFVLTLILFRPLIIIATSIDGAVMLLMGTFALLMRWWPGVGHSVEGFLEGTSWSQAALVAALALIGVILQFLDGGAKGAARAPARKAKKPAEDDDED